MPSALSTTAPIPAPELATASLTGARLLGCSGTSGQEVIIVALSGVSQREEQLAIVGMVRRQRSVRITIEEIEE